MTAHLMQASPGMAGDWWKEGTGDMEVLLQGYQIDYSSQYKGITTDHWQSDASQTKCTNPSCNRRFTLTERRHHCRRCGKLFCKPCTSYRRRLSVLAHPDPAGNLYKVCASCYGDPQSLGQMRSIMEDFSTAKWAFRQGAPPGQWQAGSVGAHISSRRSLKPELTNRLDALVACDRLTAGFYESYKASTLLKAAQDLKRLVKKPKWKLPANNVYEQLVPACRGCLTQFGLLQKRHFCTTCGAATCTACSTLDLLVYVPNDGDKSFAQWAIIKIIGLLLNKVDKTELLGSLEPNILDLVAGYLLSSAHTISRGYWGPILPQNPYGVIRCPEKEPDACVYLRVCAPCRELLVGLQAQEVLQASVEVESGDVLERVDKIYTKLMTIQGKIDDQLPKYQDLIDSLEIVSEATKAPPQHKSNTQVLAKAQSDLSDHFSQLVITIQEVKASKPTTKGQGTVLRNLLKSKCRYYQENTYTFRELKRRLETITPLKVLSVIQDIVDRNAINSCYLSVKQLALEVLHLSLKCGLPDSLMVALTPLEQVVFEDLEVSIVRAGEDWDDHQACVNQLLQLQLKNHRLVRLSSQVTTVQAEAEVRRRSAHLLHQVQLQLTTKCADRSFPRSKAALDMALGHF